MDYCLCVHKQLSTRDLPLPIHTHTHYGFCNAGFGFLTADLGRTQHIRRWVSTFFGAPGRRLCNAIVILTVEFRSGWCECVCLQAEVQWHDTHPQHHRSPGEARWQRQGSCVADNFIQRWKKINNHRIHNTQATCMQSQYSSFCYTVARWLRSAVMAGNKGALCCWRNGDYKFHQMMRQNRYFLQCWGAGLFPGIAWRKLSP